VLSSALFSLSFALDSKYSHVYMCVAPFLQVADFVRAAAECALQIHARGLQASPGDVLIFLPGMEEVDQCCEYVKERADNSDG